MSRVRTPAARLFFADDHPIFIAGLRALFNESDDVEVVGEATAVAQISSVFDRVMPDIAVVDVLLGGVSIIRRLIAAYPDVHVICLSAHEDMTNIRQAIQDGARAYVLKSSAEQHLKGAVDAVSRGGVYIDPAIAHRVVALGENSSLSYIGRRGSQQLTEREREVLRLIALGYMTKEVAVKLGITGKSVETYKTRATDKLNIRSRAKIVQYAMMQGWFRSEPGR
jgi:DNA-binding NarL/FixJ family response regulator